MESEEPRVVNIDGEAVSLDALINGYKQNKELKHEEKKAVTKRRQEQELKPYQAELIKLQKHLEEHGKKMI
jgi:polyphosphate kinase 2 (PPK2 family)